MAAQLGTDHYQLFTGGFVNIFVPFHATPDPLLPFYICWTNNANNSIDHYCVVCFVYFECPGSVDELGSSTFAVANMMKYLMNISQTDQKWDHNQSLDLSFVEQSHVTLLIVRNVFEMLHYADQIDTLRLVCSYYFLFKFLLAGPKN